MSVPIDHNKYEEEDIEYWLAQMSKPDLYAAMMAATRQSPVSVYANHATLVQMAQKYCNIELVQAEDGAARGDKWETIEKALANGSICIQFRHNNDWSNGNPEMVTHKGRIGFVNIAAYTLWTMKSQLEMATETMNKAEMSPVEELGVVKTLLQELEKVGV